MAEHVILVAFSVDADTQALAQQTLIESLPDANSFLDFSVEHGVVTSWWVAEDERYDGSDNDSAVFVSPGSQVAAARLLFRHGLTEYHNIPKEAGE